jgi:2-methylisocitrate lyase-like PEP mutase family enzyme
VDAAAGTVTGMDSHEARFAEFLAAHRGPRPLVLPNAWDPASAAALFAAGFAAVGTTSLGVAASNGLPDGEGATRDATLDLARRMAAMPGMVTVDIENGFSDDPETVARTARDLADLGIVGINIEDGRAGGTLADPEAQAVVIAAIKEECPNLFVNARTDAYWVGLDRPLEHSLERAARYTAAGADGVFVPGAIPDADVRTLVEQIDAPLNLFFVPGRHRLDDLAALGVARISTGSLLYRTAIGAAVDAATTIRDGGAPSADVPSYQDAQAWSISS